MPGSAILSCRNAIYDKIKNNASIVAIADVYQIPPDNMSFPYIDIPSTTETIDDTYAGTGSNFRDVTLTVNIWSDEKYDDQVNVLGDLVVDTLNWSTLTLTEGWTFISINLENINSRLSDDYRQISARFRVRCLQ
tara:strand:+ start:673 stop:1077 length:405 start_codon:yes stop_codon:yes gene_type:complete